ncbi:MAG: two-component sensor histidine kinase, partial [Phenylobacterium zucineum]
MTSRVRIGAPIGVQLVLLIVACLLATHLIVFVAVIVAPPPRPQVYRLSEIATALKGGSLATRDGRPMERSLVTALPEELTDPRQPRRGPPRDGLAAALGHPPGDVRLAPRRPSLWERLVDGPRGGQMMLDHRRPMGPPGSPPPPRDELRPAPPGGDPGPPRLRAMWEAPVVGDFTAALRQPDGRWVVVQSRPEPFPNSWQRRALLLLGVSFLVVAPAGLLFARHITAPLKRFSDAAERLGRDPRAEPVALSGPAEIGAAAEAFNNMQRRLKRYVDDRTAMVGAISHDLRTPLARIRFKLEAAPPKVRESVLSDVGQMEQMIQGVLAFIRNEGAPRTREKLDLLSLAECVADDAAMLGADVEMAESEPVTVEGDPVALQRMLTNLVDNAVKYGGQARLSVRRDGDLAMVEVADHGPGLSADDLEQVFQPFYRADASRNLDSGGIGLGLPIAR